MSRRTGPQCKLCRREGMKLYLKGSRCDTVKCSLSQREYPPGMHTWRRGSPSEYCIHLREKQKLKRYFGMNDGQFRRIFQLAERAKGNTGENLLVLLERRLDNVVYLLGWGLSRPNARQLVGHGHIQVNDKKVDIPSYLVKEGDVIKIKDADKSKKKIKENLEASQGSEIPGWIEPEEETPQGRILRMPTSEEASLPVAVQLVVELCSR